MFVTLQLTRADFSFLSSFLSFGVTAFFLVHHILRTFKNYGIKNVKANLRRYKLYK